MLAAVAFRARASQDTAGVREGGAFLKHHPTIIEQARHTQQGNRYGQVVQGRQGIWLHYARRRRGGSVRPFFGNPHRGLQNPQGRAEGDLRRKVVPEGQACRQHQAGVSGTIAAAGPAPAGAVGRTPRRKESARADRAVLDGHAGEFFGRVGAAFKPDNVYYRDSVSGVELPKFHLLERAGARGARHSGG